MVFNASEEACDTTACVVVGLWADNVTIPADGYVSDYPGPTEAQMEVIIPNITNRANNVKRLFVLFYKTA